MLGTEHLTHTTSEQKMTAPGMAHFAGSGPEREICGNCKHFGYWKRVANKSGQFVTSKRAHGCGKFHELTGVHGPAISKNLYACKYFESRARA
jgi:hypothetical protein